MTDIQDTISFTEDSIKEAISKVAATAAGVEHTPEQKVLLTKTMDAAAEFEKYISKWMALESIERLSEGFTQGMFVSAMCEALSASLAKMVVLSGWSDQIALTGFASALADYRKAMEAKMETLKKTPEAPLNG